MHAAHHTGASMALAHGLATLVTVVLVRQADAAVHTIADLLRTLLDALLPTLGTPRVPTTYPRLAIRATVAPVLTGHRQRRHPDRGPPFAPQLLPSPTPVPWSPRTGVGQRRATSVAASSPWTRSGPPS